MNVEQITLTFFFFHVWVMYFIYKYESTYFYSKISLHSRLFYVAGFTVVVGLH